MADDQTLNRDAHAASSDPTAPINTEEPMSERIARLKREQAEREQGESGAPTSGNVESTNTSTTAASADRDMSDPQRSAGRTAARSDATLAAGASLHAGASPSGSPAEGTDHATAAANLSEGQARVSDGSESGERARATSTSIVPESNDVMLGDQSTRKDGAKDIPNALPAVQIDKLQTDGSTSPHDATSDGSRQEAGHQQLRDAVQGKTEADDQPAFRAEAKARTI